jgi:hypothetical protein
MPPFHGSALRHIAYHVAALAGVALLVRLGYGDRAHATLAAACATGLAGSLLLGATFVRGALRWRITRRLWSPNVWLATATMMLGLPSFAAFCTVGLLASSLWKEGWPVWAFVVVKCQHRNRIAHFHREELHTGGSGSEPSGR